MRTKEKPEPLGQRGRATNRKRQYFNQSYSSTARKKFKSKSHWSRSPEQRARDAASLASLGLDFERVENTSFSSFCRKGVY